MPDFGFPPHSFRPRHAALEIVCRQALREMFAPGLLAPVDGLEARHQLARTAIASRALSRHGDQDCNDRVELDDAIVSGAVFTRHARSLVQHALASAATEHLDVVGLVSDRLAAMAHDLLMAQRGLLADRGA